MTTTDKLETIPGTRAGHTRRQWRVAATGDVIDQRGCCVAKIHEMPGQDATERAANARLIAAAPQMLEALRGLLSDPYLSDPINDDRMQAARAAIAAATGNGGAA